MEESDLYRNYSEINENIHKFDELYYAKTASEYDAMYSDYLPKDKNAKILDIGCGNGIFLYYLKNYGYTNFDGIDVDQSSVDIVKRHVTDRVIKTNASNFLEGKKEYFDVIVMNEVMEHIEKNEIIPLINQIYNALAHGGIFICYVPNMENPFTTYTRYHDFTHTIGFTQNSLRMVMKLGGFKNIEVIATVPKRKSLKKTIKRLLQNIVKKALVLLFEYPPNGYIHCMRIFSVAKK